MFKMLTEVVKAVKATTIPVSDIYGGEGAMACTFALPRNDVSYIRDGSNLWKGISDILAWPRSPVPFCIGYRFCFICIYSSRN